MDTNADHLVTIDIQSDLTNSNEVETILDLSQRSATISTVTVLLPKESFVIIDNWSNESLIFDKQICDMIENDEWKLSADMDENIVTYNIEQSLTDQHKNHVIKEDSLSDSSNQYQSKLEVNSISKKTNSSIPSHVIYEIKACTEPSIYSSSNFLWSKYFSLIGERPISDEFFDHYLASVESSLEVDMRLEYCYDSQRDIYWLTQIQMISHRLILLHYVGIPEEDTSQDFWADVYDQRCHPIGWCKENSKLMLPPSFVTERLTSEEITAVIEKSENDETPPTYLFDPNIGLTPAEQLHVGMILELQDVQCPWTLWFVRIMNNRGGRLDLRYINGVDLSEENGIFSCSNDDLHLFYLDRRVHSIGWISSNASIYSYEIPSNLELKSDKQTIIDRCLTHSKSQFLPPNVFKEQEEIVKHKFTEGMKLEVFESKSQQVFLGRIGHVHNEFYFDVHIDNDEENQYKFVAHGTHPHILPPHWAAEHRLALMKDKTHRLSDEFWNVFSEENGIADLAPERCFNLITLNAAGSNRVEPGMKLEMIYTYKNNDIVFSVTLIHVADHLMWLRVDHPKRIDDETFFYHVVPINSLDVFPVGWAKHNGFELIFPMEFRVDLNIFDNHRSTLFSSVTRYPRIPRVYLTDVYLLTIYVNIRCFSGPHLCSSRLARIPSKFGPGPFRHVLIDLFHFLLPTISTSAHRILRRLDHQSHSDSSQTKMRTEFVKAAKKASKLIRPISIPTEPTFIHQYLRHVCTQLEACPNLISLQHFDECCPEKCSRLNNTFAFSTHSKHKRTGVAQLRAAQNRQRKQKSLLGQLKADPNVASPMTEDLPPIPVETNVEEKSTSINPIVDLAPGSDRQTRGFRVHFEHRTHTITRTNRKQQKIKNEETSILPNVRLESKRIRNGKTKRPLSPDIAITTPKPVTLNILPSSSDEKAKKKRRRVTADISSPSSSSQIDSDSSNSLVHSTPFLIPPAVDTQNPVTWNVNDVCSYLNESGCSFALKTIKEQEIDGAALLLLDDINTVRDLLEFKLGPAVKFFHVVEKLRNQVIKTIHSSPSLKTSSSTKTR